MCWRGYTIRFFFFSFLRLRLVADQIFSGSNNSNHINNSEFFFFSDCHCDCTVYRRRVSLVKLGHDQWGDQLVVNYWSKSEETLDWLWEDSFKASCEWADTVCGILWEPLNSRKSHLGQFVLQGTVWWYGKSPRAFSQTPG